MTNSHTDLLNRCKKIVLGIIPDSQIVLYGSRARGDAGTDSDFDLLVLVNGPVDWKIERLLGNRLYDLELETGKILSLQVISRDKWDSPLFQAMPFRKNVEREGITI